MNVCRKIFEALQNSCSRILKQLLNWFQKDEFTKMLNEYGYALAFAHFFYCKKYLFPDLKNSREIYEDKEKKLFALKKVLFFIPDSTEYSINESSTQYHSTLEPAIASVAGTADREYYPNILKAEFGFIHADMPSCLLSIKRIKDLSPETDEKLTNAVINKIREDFVKVLNALLNSDGGCRGRYEFILYQDQGEISETVFQVLRRHWLNDYVCPEEKLSGRQLKFCFDYYGDCLAYLYYTNFLLRVLPDLKISMQKWEKEQDVELTVKKFILLIPESSYTLDRLDYSSFDDTNIEVAQHLPVIMQSVGFNSKRSYKIPVYKITSKHQEHHLYSSNQKNPITYYVCTDYPPPIKQLDNTKYHSNLTKKEIHKQNENFSNTLKNLLKKDKQYGELCEILNYKDEGCKRLSEVLENFIIENKQLSQKHC